MTENATELLMLYERMVTVRQFETMAGERHAAGEIPGFIHLSIGQEASSVGVCADLRADDYVVTTHRGHGHMIAKGADLKKMTAELFARRTGYCKGKGGSMHVADFAVGILGANGVVAGGLPIIAGAGFSIKMRGTDQVAVCFFGDGASNRGTVHEVMNLAAVWTLPILFVIENNRWASTTPQSDSCALEDICGRAAAYGMPGLAVDGNDVLAVKKAAGEAVARARAGQGPTLLENKTYRVRGHFEGDPQRYRSAEEVARWQRDNDPLKRFAAHLSAAGLLSPEQDAHIQSSVAAAIHEAVDFARQSPFPEPHEALEDLYATTSWEGGR